jgi:two-component system, NtrC family, sensor histidine kinase PilS
MAIDFFSRLDAKITSTRWRSLKLYNLYRLIISVLLFFTQGLSSDVLANFNISSNSLLNSFSSLVVAYFIFSAICAILTWLEKPNLDYSLPTQIVADIAFIALIMHTQQGSQSSIGLLLIVTIAAGSLISVGRLALFYASIATISILLEQTFHILDVSSPSENYTSAVLLSLGCFATAWLAYSLAKRSQESELLAAQRGLDIQNMAQINALITDEMQDGVLVVDQDLLIKHHNHQAEVLLGLDSKQTYSDNWKNKSLNEVSPEVESLMQYWLAEKVPEHGFVPTHNAIPSFIKLTALSRELRLRFLPISENRNQGAVIFIEDWSQMQTQAHQVKLAALGRLTANIAHEIRNPLSAISHANQLLQEEDTDPATKRMLQIISDNVQRLDQIIKDVLELNRRDRTNQETIHLESFMHDFYTQFCAVEKIPESSFTLSLKTAETIVAFDRRHLNQILWNLCKNGWRHCRKLENSLKLALHVNENANTIRVEITDDGEGVPENIQAHLFEPFFTTENTGTGLGLYIARELADANGAKLQYKALDSDDGSGSQFIMHLKRA